MDILNSTKLTATYTMGLDPDGRERLVIVAKGTFLIPRHGEPVTAAPTNDPLVFADTFTGEPGFSAVLHESEFAPYKPRCDVLAVATAYAPNAQPATRVPVSMRVGAMYKEFDVVGSRYWTASAFGITPSAGRAFTSMAIAYDSAFGGSEPVGNDPVLRNSYPPNPVGCGYFPKAGEGDIFGKPAPTTEERGRPITTPRKSYRPMSFGPIGCNFEHRIHYAGTYDAQWLDETFPFLPANFDSQYFQAAPPDQQIEYPRGGEMVHLVNLTPYPVPQFALPALNVPVEVSRVGGRRTAQEANLDTVVFEPDRGVFNLVFRTSFPLERNIQEVRQIIVGPMSNGFYRARARGKSYYSGIGKLAAANRDRLQ